MKATPEQVAKYNEDAEQAQIRLREQERMSDLAQKLRDSTKFYHLDCELKMECAARIEELEDQNKKLLEALRKISNMAVPVQKEEHRIAREAMLRAAIAKAKGEE